MPDFPSISPHFHHLFEDMPPINLDSMPPINNEEVLNKMEASIRRNERSPNSRPGMTEMVEIWKQVVENLDSDIAEEERLREDSLIRAAEMYGLGYGWATDPRTKDLKMSKRELEIEVKSLKKVIGEKERWIEKLGIEYRKLHARIAMMESELPEGRKANSPWLKVDRKASLLGNIFAGYDRW